MANTAAPCEIGQVLVDNTPVTRCVRYFLAPEQAADPIEYVIKFENKKEATDAVEDVVITDVLDSSLDPSTVTVFTSSHPNNLTTQVTGNTVTFSFLNVEIPPNVNPPLGEGFVHFTVRPKANLPIGTEIKNKATIFFCFNFETASFTGCLQPIATPEVNHLLIANSDVSVASRASPDPAILRTNLTYTLTVTNDGPSNATGVTLTNMLPAGVTFVSATTSLGTCSSNGNQVNCALGNLVNGASATVTLVALPTQVGTLTNVATASVQETDPDSGEIGIAPPPTCWTGRRRPWAPWRHLLIAGRGFWLASEVYPHYGRSRLGLALAASLLWVLMVALPQHPWLVIWRP